MQLLEIAPMYTGHAQTRMAQRGISSADVEYVCKHGFRIYAGGLLHIHLRMKDIPYAEQAKYSFRADIQVRMEQSSGSVVTVFRNRKKCALHKVRRKAKTNRKRMM